MIALGPILSSLTSRLDEARQLARGWLHGLWLERPEALEALLCGVYELDPGTGSPGVLLRQRTRGGNDGFETALGTLMPDLFIGAGAMAAPPKLVDDPFSAFTASWNGDGSGSLLLNRAWAEQATVVDLTDMLLEQALPIVGELLGLPEPRIDGGRMFAEGILGLVEGLDGAGIEAPRLAAFSSSSASFDHSEDLNWLLQRQQVLHLAGMVDDFLALLRRLAAPTAGGTGGAVTHSLSLDLGAFQIATSQLRIEDAGLQSHIGEGRLLSFTLSPGTRLPSLADGSPIPRGWNEGRPQELYLRPSAAGSSLFDVFTGINVAGAPVDRLRLSEDQETVAYSQQDTNNLYSSGAFVLPDAERAEIDRIVATIAAGNQTVADVRISASTDPEPLTPSLRTKLLNLGYEGTNRGLAVARADAMRSYLLSRLDSLPGLDQPQLQLLLPPVPRLPEANTGLRRYSDATYTLAWEQGTAPRDPSARFVQAELDLDRRLVGGGTLQTNWTTSQPAVPGGGESSGLSLDLGDLLCRFTASYGVQDLRVLFDLLFPAAEQGNANDTPFWEGASGEALAAGLLLWGYDNILPAGGADDMFSRLLDRIPELEPLMLEGLASREGNLPSYRREGGRERQGRAVLRLGGAAGGRALREDGAQRH